jgi:DNA-binding transcriptional MerR regulator
MLSAVIPVTRPDRTYEIHEVAELTGLAAARLRAWERRYEVVRPRRLSNRYRVYTADQVALLRAYARLIAGGERIGDLAACEREDVLARAEVRSLDGSPQAALLEAVRAFDRERLEGLVAQQLALRGLRAFAQEVVLPLAQSVGDLWALGRVPIAAEHLATEVVVHALKGGLRTSRGAGPLLVTLAVAQEDGWRIQYLGADLPVDAVVEAAWKLSPEGVAFSGSDPSIVRASLPALAAVVGKLPPRTMAAIGGAGVGPHTHLLRGYGLRIGLEAFTRGGARVARSPEARS